MTHRRHLRLLTFSLVTISILFKLAHCSTKFVVALNQYDEFSNDLSTKCIKMCVISPSTGKPRCHLNTTVGYSTVSFRPGKRICYNLQPYKFSYPFTKWQRNSELEITVWNRPAGKTCNSPRPVNTTIHGTGRQLIKRYLGGIHYAIKDTGSKWKLDLSTKFVCPTKNCLVNCKPRDDSTGHYTCVDDNKKCLSNWYGPNCLKKCIPRNDSFGHYNCSELGEKECLVNWYGNNCTNFCDRNAKNYNCTTHGRKTCFPGWFGEDCQRFCNKSATNYVCLENGHRICLPNWYGEMCSNACNNSATAYKCNDQGEKVCSYNWYGANCTKFCNNSATTYRCSDQGERNCLPQWYGDDCTKFCDNSAATYRCNRSGDRQCLLYWYGKECNIHCHEVESVPHVYLCKVDEGSTAICPKGWKDTGCSSPCMADKSQNLDNLLARCTSDNKTSLCLRNITDMQRCELQSPAALKTNSEKTESNTVLLVGLFGTLLLIIIVTAIVLLLISIKKRSSRNNVGQSPSSSLVRQFNHKELILNIDELMRNHDPEYEELAYENVGMMVDNPLYDAARKLRATTSF